MAAEKTPERVRYINKSTVVRYFREKGPCPETIQMLNNWIAQKQRQVEEGQITRVAFNMSLADLYRDAHLFEQALEAYSDAYELILGEARYVVEQNNAFFVAQDSRFLQSYIRYLFSRIKILDICQENKERLQKIMESWDCSENNRETLDS